MAPRPGRTNLLSNVAGWHGAAPNTPGTFKFVVLSDRTGGHIPGKMEEAIAEVNLLKPDFVVCVGDLIEGYVENDPPKLEGMWQETDAILAKLDAPFFYTPGNHDVTYDTMRKEYTRRHGVGGRSWYSFNYGNCHFVVLDSYSAIRSAGVAKAEVEWLKQDMASAGGAEHVFVMYHHPWFASGERTEKGDKLYRDVVSFLPKDKTTIFNGHWHTLAAFDEGVPSYVIPATGAEGDDKTPADLGGGNHFALVSVDQGKPTISLIEVGTIRPISIAQDAEAFGKMLDTAQDMNMSVAGGKVVFRQTNTMKAPVTITPSLAAEGYEVAGDAKAVTVQPGQSVEFAMTFRQTGPADSKPGVKATYEFQTATGKQLKVAKVLPIATHTEITIAMDKKIEVDGNLEDWADVPAVVVDHASQIMDEKDHWKGPQDASATMQAATDGTLLSVAFKVSDDQLCAEKSKTSWNNDGVELFWDARPADKRDGKAGPGTGQIILNIPAQGEKPAAYIAAEKEPIKSDLKTAYKKIDGGYVIELSIPLKDLGMTGPVVEGQGINLEMSLDDRDEDAAGEGHMTYMSTAGAADASKKTSGYAIGTFKK